MKAHQSIAVFTNPIWFKCVRARLRLKHILSWGTVVLTITGFVCLMIFVTMTEQADVPRELAARAMIGPLVITQAIILMLAGTGAVASGMTQERADALLDYHRMTPMTPVAKIVGFLFGLPVREYFLFALTLPFLAFAVIVGKFSLTTLLHFYVVFFSAVLLYHMTGLVSGMVTKKPRRASMLAQGMVLLIYFVLPQLKWFGLSFFEYLTFRPAFTHIVADQLEGVGAPSFLLESWGAVRDGVPFFDTTLHPSVYSLLVQGFLLASMFVVVYRKWVAEPSHSFSKSQGLLFFAGTLTFFMGSLWPILSDQSLYSEVVNNMFPGQREEFPLPLLYLLMLVLLTVTGVLILFVVHVVSPVRQTFTKALHRTRKLGIGRLPLDSDGASSLLPTLLMIVLACTAVGILIAVELRSDRFLSSLPPVEALVAPFVLFTAVILFAQGMRERFSSRVCFVGLFLVWMLPMFTCLLMFASNRAWVTGTYIALPFPPVSVWLTVARFFEQATLVGDINEMTAGLDAGERILAIMVPPKLRGELASMTRAATLGYCGLAIVMQWELWRWKRELHREVLPT